MSFERPKFHLDTNSCIYLFRNEFPALANRVQQSQPLQIGISAAVYAEILYGVRQGKGPPMEMLDRFIRQVPVRSIGVDVAHAYARLPLKRGTLDHLIAAHALAEEATLISKNSRDFFRSDELLLEDWTV